MTSSAYVSPSPHTDAVLPKAALTLTVGFAGHRNLPEALLEPVLIRVFEVVRQALIRMGDSSADTDETILEAHRAVWPSTLDKPAMRLLVGFAPGADQVAVRAWRGLELGRVHGLYPFADLADPTRFAWTDDPANMNDAKLRIDLGPSGVLDDATVLDGTSTRKNVNPFRDPHLEQSRWLLRWSDIVVVAWNGELAAGPGGTGDLVALAMAAIQPIIWIDTSRADMPAKVVMPMRLWHDTAFSEALITLHACDGADDKVLAELSEESVLLPLLARFRPPEQETCGRRDYAKGPLFKHPLLELGTTIVARLWPWLHRRFGSIEPPQRDPGPRADTSPIVAARLSEADAHAGRLGNLHRSAQLILLILAVLAVVLGTFPAIVPGAKIYCVGLEFLAILLAMAMYSLLGRITTNQRWSDARRLAERLRALDATWPLGFDVGDEHSDAPSTWTEWHARAVRRAAGPPTGVLSATRRHDMADAGRLDLMGIVLGQSRYHKLAARRALRFHRALHRLEAVLTLFLLTALLVYVALYFASSDEQLHHVGGALLMASAVVPAIAAACLGVEAKLGLTEVAHRSAALRARFADIVDEMETTTQLQRKEELLRAAATLVVADVDRWRDAASHRIIATF